MNSQLSTPDSQLAAICLTDSPFVAALKREFYALDLQEQELKAEIENPAVDGWLKVEARTELERVRSRKAEIAKQIFNHR